MKMRRLVLYILPALLTLRGVAAAPADSHAPTNRVESPRAAPPSDRPLPTWYVFKIKSFKKVTHSEDSKSAIVEGVTMKDREFKIKVVWDEVFNGAHKKAIDQWLKKPKAEFDANVPYIIAGEVLSREPLTIKPDTLVSHAPNFGAPPENVY